MSEPHHQHGWKEAVFKVVTGICIGFGASQITVARQVVEMSKDAEHLRERVQTLDTRTDQRISDLVKTINTSISQNSEFLSALREANAIQRMIIEREKRP